jgi:hypothetical protein
MTNAELHLFSGSSDAVAQSLYALPSSVVKQAMWALLLQSPSGGVQIHIMERSDENNGRVLVWHGTGLGTVPVRLASTFMLNHPDAERMPQVRRVLLAHGDYEDLGVVPCPPTARGAFGHPMRLHAQAAQMQAIVVAG